MNAFIDRAATAHSGGGPFLPVQRRQLHRTLHFSGWSENVLHTAPIVLLLELEARRAPYMPGSSGANVNIGSMSAITVLG